MAKKSNARNRAQAEIDRRNTPQEKKKQTRTESSGSASLGYDPAQINTVMFPVGQKMVLSNGDRIHIKPWSIKMFGEMAQRIPDTLMAALPDEDGNTVAHEQMASLFTELLDEVIVMVSLTIDWTPEKIQDEMVFEELAAVAIVVWDVCIMGPMAKMGGLMGRVMGTVASVSAPAAAPAIKSPNQRPSSSPQST